jgi:hypothetical protein|tara:strand:+ start:161 stop:466 length:306 start_codon:yes stop_codon:yes gene_type:complete
MEGYTSENLFSNNLATIEEQQGTTLETTNQVETDNVPEEYVPSEASPEPNAASKNQEPDLEETIPESTQSSLLKYIGKCDYLSIILLLITCIGLYYCYKDV